MLKRTYDADATFNELVWLLGESELLSWLYLSLSSDETRDLLDHIIRQTDLCNDFDDDGSFYGIFKD